MKPFRSFVDPTMSSGLSLFSQSSYILVSSFSLGRTHQNSVRKMNPGISEVGLRAAGAPAETRSACVPRLAAGQIVRRMEMKASHVVDS